MSLTLYGYPFSSYCQKVFIALREDETPFDLGFSKTRSCLGGILRALAAEAHARPAVNGDKTVVRSRPLSIDLYFDVHHEAVCASCPERSSGGSPRPQLDRFFDNSSWTPMQKIVLNQLARLRRAMAKALRKHPAACSLTPMAGLRRAA